MTSAVPGALGVYEQLDVPPCPVHTRVLRRFSFFSFELLIAANGNIAAVAARPSQVGGRCLCFYEHGDVIKR